MPFVDVVNTMLDESLPLTPGEWNEWGNPITDAAAFHYMMSYSPYDNVRRQAYPPMLISGGLNDPRVTYWEPAKWAARLRAMRTDHNLQLLKINMGAGHGGRSGRWTALHEDGRGICLHPQPDGRRGAALSRFPLVLLLVLALAGCAARMVPRAPSAPVAASVDVVRHGDRLDRRFPPRPAGADLGVRPFVGDARRPAALAARMAGPSRRRASGSSIAAITTSSSRENGGAGSGRGAAALHALRPRSARRFRPRYAFTNGATALFSRQFDLFALPDAAAVAQLPVDISVADIPYTRTRATFRDEGGRILYAGQRLATVSLDDEDGTYVLFGPTEPMLSAGIAAIIDPGLPQWIHDALTSATPDILDRLTAALARRRGPSRP